jgi:hypothetical protein
MEHDPILELRHRTSLLRPTTPKISIGGRLILTTECAYQILIWLVAAVVIKNGKARLYAQKRLHMRAPLGC